MGNLGLDPETALKLIQMLLQGAAYFFAGFALLAVLTYVVFLCLEIFASQPRPKFRIAKVPQPVRCASTVEHTLEMVPAETPTLAKEAIATEDEVLCEDRIRDDFPSAEISAHRRPLGIDTSNA